MKYNKLFHEKFVHLGFNDKLNDILKKAELDGWISDMEHEYNCLHKQQICIRKECENKCRKLKMVAVAWSPQLSQINLENKLW